MSIKESLFLKNLFFDKELKERIFIGDKLSKPYYKTIFFCFRDLQMSLIFVIENVLGQILYAVNSVDLLLRLNVSVNEQN